MYMYMCTDDVCVGEGAGGRGPEGGVSTFESIIVAEDAIRAWWLSFTMAAVRHGPRDSHRAQGLSRIVGFILVHSFYRMMFLIIMFN